MNCDGSTRPEPTYSPDLEPPPELSRDGTKIVFTRRNPDPSVTPNPLIWVMNVDGSDQHQVFVPICVSPHGAPDVCVGVSRDTYPKLVTGRHPDRLRARRRPCSVPGSGS